MNIKTLAAIDIGTNSLHLIVVTVNDNGNFEIIDREKEVIRLGEGSGGNIKIIKPAPMERAITTLKRFKGIADSYSAKIRAVATSAVRESNNKVEFINTVLKETGIEVEVINGIEEARLIYLGVLKAVPVYEKKSLILDIGGGSTELLIGQNGEPIYSTSLKLGAVRLTERFFPNSELTEERIKECREWVEGEIFLPLQNIKQLGFDVCVGSSGTIMAAGLLIHAQKKKNISSSMILNNYEITYDQLKSVEKEILKGKTTEKRKRIYALDPERADIIPAGIIILSEIFKQLNLEKLKISGFALREGIIIDTLQKLETTGRKPKLSNIRLDSVLHLAESCLFDKTHCSHIAKLSLQMYDQLKSIHKLENICREYLEAAALLHDIGYHIAHNNHHRHSYYIIMNSELLGFNENEIAIIANVARYHRRSHPKLRHTEFVSLSSKSQLVVKRLAAILRIADSLDRTHLQKISKITIENSDSEVILKLHSADVSLDIELWNFDRRKGLFEEVFNKKVKTEILD
jgi:exopolyphosphatase / guanosine-5'-triphosphate,3'-diphosphate pyrophosphatase